MSQNDKNNIFAHIFFSRGMVVFLFFIIIFISLGLFSIVNKSIDANIARKHAELEAEALIEKQKVLSDKLSSLQTREGQERALKEQYSVVKEGEQVVVISDDSIEDLPVSNNQNSNKKDFWSFLRDLFVSESK